MSNTITHYQSEERFGQNSDTLNVLQELSEKRPETKQDFENLKKAIEKFNSVEIEIDISIRYKSETFY
jgi:hypothetical protein